MTNQTFIDAIQSSEKDSLLPPVPFDSSVLPTDEGFVRAWSDLKTTQKRYVVNRQAARTMTEAARMSGVSIDTVRCWPDWVHDLAIRISDYRAQQVLRLIHNVSLKALEIKIEALDSADERIKQQAADFFLEHTIGKPGQTSLVSNDGDGVQNIQIFIPNNDRQQFDDSELISENDVAVIIDQASIEHIDGDEEE